MRRRSWKHTTLPKCSYSLPSTLMRPVYCGGSPRRALSSRFYVVLVPESIGTECLPSVSNSPIRPTLRISAKFGKRPWESVARIARFWLNIEVRTAANYVGYTSSSGHSAMPILAGEQTAAVVVVSDRSYGAMYPRRDGGASKRNRNGLFQKLIKCEIRFARDSQNRRNSG